MACMQDYLQPKVSHNAGSVLQCRSCSREHGLLASWPCLKTCMQDCQACQKAAAPAQAAALHAPARPHGRRPHPEQQHHRAHHAALPPALRRARLRAGMHPQHRRPRPRWRRLLRPRGCGVQRQPRPAVHQQRGQDELHHADRSECSCRMPGSRDACACVRLSHSPCRCTESVASPQDDLQACVKS